LFGLENPTLLALPHLEGFSGMAWLQATKLTFTNMDWTEERRWLPVPTAQLGALFDRIATTPFTAFWQPEMSPQPDWLRLKDTETVAAKPASGLRIEGPVSDWVLERSFELPSWPPRMTSANDFDLLTNSIVQALVDGAGRTLSATLLTSSGSQAADDFALNQVRMARFLPPGKPSLTSVAARAANQLRWGRLIFEWQTVPVNHPSAASP
jgi:hypothetical protein